MIKKYILLKSIRYLLDIYYNNIDNLLNNTELVDKDQDYVEKRLKYYTNIIDSLIDIKIYVDNNIK